MSLTRRSPFLLVILLAARGSRDVEVSGDSACRGYTEENIAVTSRRNDLEAARTLRDWFIECDLTKERFDDALKWAKVAAEKGTAEDRRFYQGLVEAASNPPPQEQSSSAGRSSLVHCTDDKSVTVDQGCAIEIAKSEIARREGVQPYSRFSANFDDKDGTWVVMAIHEPEQPGGHIFVLVSTDGRVLDYALGR